jgi:hypothetical protein
MYLSGRLMTQREQIARFTGHSNSHYRSLQKQKLHGA